MNKIDDDTLDAVAGGYIVYDHETGMYALVDDRWGQVKCQFNMLEMAKKDANRRNSNGEISKRARECNDQVISIEEYERLFGKKW